MRRSRNYPSQTILDTLKFSNILDSNFMKEGIAIIKSAANKSCCNRFSGRKQYIPAKITFEKYVV